MADPSAEFDIQEGSSVARTRSAVLNVLVVVAAGIAASGWILGRHEPDGPLPWPSLTTRQVAFAILGLLVTLSYTVLRSASRRETLRDPITRAGRFYRGRLAASVIAGLAIPLGFAYGWYVDSRLQGIAPFWVAGLAIGFLAMPRGGELDDLDD